MPRLSLLLLLFCSGCTDFDFTLAQKTVDRSDPLLVERSGVLLLNGTPFSGLVIERDGDKLRSKTPYRKGQRHGRAYAYHPDGRLAYEKLFRNGNREGTHRGWWPNGTLQFAYTYEHDLFEGEETSYYKNGVRAELRHYRKGREEGQQTTWNGDGQIVSNYTMKEGKLYGIVGRFDCVSVHSQ